MDIDLQIGLSSAFTSNPRATRHDYHIQKEFTNIIERFSEIPNGVLSWVRKKISAGIWAGC